MIDAAVNGGIANFQEAFFTGDFAAQHPDLAVHVPQLKALIQEEVSWSGRLPVTARELRD